MAQKRFIVSLISMTVSAAALIWTIPSLFRPGEGNLLLVGLLACLVAVSAVGTRCWRPSTPASAGE